LSIRSRPRSSAGAVDAPPKRTLREQPPISFAPVRIVAGVAPVGLAGPGRIEIEFATGARMRISGAADAATLTAAVADLAEGRGR
jgi:transposase